MIIICCSFRGSMTQKPLLFSFLKVQSKYTVHKVIISKFFIWSWYSIHFVSLHLGSYWLINHLNVLKAEDSSTPIIMPTLPDYQGVSQSLKQTLRVSHMGHQTFKIKEDLVQLHTETSHSNSRFPTSNVICPFINIRVLILIFLIALRLFQSRDYTFF